MKNKNNFIKKNQRFRILIAPLDWGLGHATRCVPIINELICLNCEVFIAADSHISLLLKKEFPDAVFIKYKSYGINYGKNKRQFALKMLSQLPKICNSVLKENRWLKKAIEEYNIDAVISDNRFGMHSTRAPSVYITHQLAIKTGNIFFDRLAKRAHQYFIKKFYSCWVPDFRENGLAGQLSHPAKIPGNVVYIGPLSRFKKLEEEEKLYDLLISISGPEPQRSIFEKMLLSQLKQFSGKVLLVRGLPASQEQLSMSNSSIEIVNHLSAIDLNKAIMQSKMVICRSGYTSIMDLVKLQKSAILVPTPGQTEQEYLAAHLSKMSYFYSADQADFSLQTALENAKHAPLIYPERSLEEYKNVIHEFVSMLQTRDLSNK